MIDESGDMRIGALDPLAWTGLVLTPGPGRGFAIRFAVQRSDGTRIDGEDFYYLTHEVGPHAPDGGYARMAFDLDLPPGLGTETPIVPRAGRSAGLVLEWARTGESIAVGRASLAVEGRLELHGYFPWDWGGVWRRDGSVLIGVTTDGGQVVAIALDPAPGPRGEGPGSPSPAPEIAVAFPEPIERTVRFAAALGRDVGGAREAARGALATGVDATLESARRAYTSTAVHVDGAWADLGGAVTRSLAWTVALQPERGRLYTPAGRRWIFPRPDGGRKDWTLFGWDSLFNALELAVESPDLARSTLMAVLDAAYPNGNVPNWRGRYGGTPDRSTPPLGAYTALVLYERTGDRALLEAAYPALARWSDWWRAPKRDRARRDGNGDGLFEWGADIDLTSPTPPPWEADADGHRRATWESGQDDLPNWDDARWVPETETLDLDAVDLNAYLALDLECLARIAATLGDDAAAEACRSRRAALCDRMNEVLWDEDRGLYLDRYWDGRRSERIAASNFLPLLAGVPDPGRAQRMLETLRRGEAFWGEWVVPTISRRDPAYGDQQYWRGTIWPPMNYLVYQGLRRYGFDVTAGELAARGVELFLRSWRTYGLARENYDSRTGEGGGRRHQSWGPLLALIGLEEFVAVTPWDGLRVGTLTPPATGSTLRRLRVRGRTWSVRLGPEGLKVEIDGARRLTTTVPVVLRDLTLERDRFSADVHAQGPGEVRAALDGSRFRLEVDEIQAEVEEPRIPLRSGRSVIRLSATP